MTVLRYDVVDVFTDRAFAGNPLAVVHGGTELSTGQMQAIAAEFGLSETAFPLPPTTPEADYRLRMVVSFDVGAMRAHLRMFAPEVGVVEDPATGSAAVALAVFLVDRGVLPPDGQTGFTVAQGAEIGRPSQLSVVVRAEGGAAVGTSVGGGVAAFSRGELVAVPDPV